MSNRKVKCQHSTYDWPLLYCTILYCTVLYCTVLYTTVLYCTVLYCTVLYSTVLYCTALYCTVLYCTVLYCTVLYIPDTYLTYHWPIVCQVLTLDFPIGHFPLQNVQSGFPSVKYRVNGQKHSIIHFLDKSIHLLDKSSKQIDKSTWINQVKTDKSTLDKSTYLNKSLGFNGYLQLFNCLQLYKYSWMWEPSVTRERISIRTPYMAYILYI